MQGAPPVECRVRTMAPPARKTRPSSQQSQVASPLCPSLAVGRPDFQKGAWLITRRPRPPRSGPPWPPSPWPLSACRSRTQCQPVGQPSARTETHERPAEKARRGEKGDAPLDVEVVDPGEVDVHDGRLLADELYVLADVCERELGPVELGLEERQGLGERVREHHVGLRVARSGLGRQRGCPEGRGRGRRGRRTPSQRLTVPVSSTSASAKSVSLSSNSVLTGVWLSSSSSSEARPSPSSVFEPCARAGQRVSLWQAAS